VRLDRLDLVRWGALADVTLDLSEGRQGLHVIYGENEAGKSTTRRAISAVLFGIPAQSSDRFRFDYKALRIGASLRFQDGSAFAFVRKKGAKDTVLDPEAGAPIDDAMLRAALGKVGRDAFEQEWSLDHDQLRRGGEALVRGDGKVGQSLLAAGLGGVGVGLLDRELQTEAHELFGRRGSRVMKLLEQVRERQREKEAHAVSVARVEELEAERAALVSEREKLAVAQKELASDLAGLDRVERAHPVLLERERLARGLARFEGVPLLPVDFGKRRSLEQQTFDAAAVELERARVAAEEAGKVAAEGLFEEEVKAAALSVGLAPEVLVRLAGERHAALFRRARELERQATRDRAHKAEIDDALAREEADLEKLVAAAKDVPREDLALATKADALVQAAKEAEALSVKAKEAAHEASAAFEALPRWARGELGRRALETARLPTPLEIGALEDDLLRAGDAVRLANEEASLKAELLRATAKIASLRGSETATSEQVAKARAHRDLGWKLVRATLEGTPMGDSERDRFARGSSLADAFDQAMRRADELADKRHEGVLDAAGLEQAHKEKNALAARLEQASRARAAAEEKAERATKAWALLWRPHSIQPGSPREMKEWVRAAEAVRERLLRQEETRKAAAEAKARHVELAVSLARLFGSDAPRDPAAVVAYVEARAKDARLARDRRDESVREATRARARIEALTEKKRESVERIARFEPVWQAFLRELDLGRAMTPEEAVDVLTRAAGLAATLQKIDDLEGRRKSALARAEEASARMAASRAALDALSVEAGTRDPAELLRVETENEKRRELLVAMERAEAELAMVARGDVAALTLAVKELPVHEIPLRRASVERAVRDFEERSRALSQSIGALDGELSKAMGGEDAARDAAAIEELHAEMGDVVADVLRLAIARDMLRQAAETYRQRNESPLLTRASALFRRVTLGSFSSITVDDAEVKEGVLKGVRGEDLVPVSGMSDGVKDQLYLALRLAALEGQLEGREPLPFVVDDILVHLSDARGRATLDVLAELAEKTQVLLFTHHARIVELARSLEGREVFAHSIEPPPPA
jgi:uncharacterized protein YhaN